MGSIILKIKKRFLYDEFAHNILIVMTGTTISQLIVIASAPILTRLFTPLDYGVFALYASVSSLLATVATGSYDSAVMLPAKDEEAANLIGLSLIITVIVSFVIVISIFAYSSLVLNLGQNHKSETWLYLVPITVLLTSIYQIVYSWSNRLKEYHKISISKIYGTGISAISTVAIGIINIGPIGLIFGSMIYPTIASLMLSWHLKNSSIIVPYLSFNTIKQVAKRYYRFPVLSLPANFLNIAAQQTPILLMANFFGPVTVGFYSLTHRVMVLPLSLIAAAVLEAFRQQASSDYNNYGNCMPIYLRTFKSLFLISIIPFTIFFFIAPSLFSFTFGSDWYIAGQYAQILTPLFLLRFTASPLSYVFFIAEKQNFDLFGQMALLAVAVLSMYVGRYYHQPIIAIGTFSVLCSLVYIWYIFMSYQFAKGKQF